MIQIEDNWQLVQRDNSGWAITNSEDCQLSPNEEIFKKVRFMDIKPYVSIALACAELVYPIYETKYPNDDRVKDCIKVTKQYLAGKISKEQLNIKRNAAYAVYAAAYAAYAAAAAAAYAAAYAAAAAAAAYAAAYAAAADAAADAAAAAETKERIKWFQDWIRQ